MSRWTSGDVRVRRVGCGLYIEAHGDGLLLDVPPRTAEALAPSELGRLRAVALSSGRMQSVGGLVGLLCALEAHRSGDAPLRLCCVLGEERGPMLAETWVRGWPGRYPLSLDGEFPGADFEVGSMRVRTVAVAHSEPRWIPEPTVQAAVGVGFRVDVGEVAVAFVPGAGPGSSVGRLVDGADLAVIEVGVTPWPRSEERQRLSMDEAVRVVAAAREAWIIGDDGAPVGAEA